MNINYSDQPVMGGSKSIFLAGPTPRNKEIPSWRPEACKYLRNLGFSGIIYVPELSSGEAQFNYDNQIAWEWEALDTANVILFWVPREMHTMPALTTNVEFGYYVKDKKVLYGRPNNAENIKYLDKLFQRHHATTIICEDLKTLCIEAVNLLKEI